MPCRQSAGARDALRLEVGKRIAECGNASEMSAVGTGACDQFDMTVKQQRGIPVLHQGGQSLGAVDQRAFVGIGQSQENGGDVAGVHGRAQLQGKSGRIRDRRRCQVEAGRRARDRLFGS